MRRTISLLAVILLSTGLSAQATRPSPRTGAKPTPGLGQQADVVVGEGEALAADGVFQVQLIVWKDSFAGSPLGNAKGITLMDGMDSTLSPGLAQIVSGMRVGGIRRAARPSDFLFGKKLRDSGAAPTGVNLCVEVTLQKVWPNQPLEVATIREGDGERKAAQGDTVRLRFTGWLDAFDSMTEFDSSEKHGNNFGVRLGGPGILEGLERATVGMSIGEVRRMIIPAYLGFGPVKHDMVPPYSELYLEVELLQFIEEGELKVEIVKPGDEQAPGIRAGNAIRVHFIGWTDKFAGEKQFVSSREQGELFTFILGKGQVIAGWDQGLLGMKPNEQRRLTIPWNLGFGEKPSGPKIPAFSTLYYDIELVEVIVPGELVTEVKKEGSGTPAEDGTTVSVHYTGWLDRFNGVKQFDTSRVEGKPWEFTLGQNKVIKGWEAGVLGMKPGEVRLLRIPWNLGYGASGAGKGKIPPFATLYYELEYLGAK